MMAPPRRDTDAEWTARVRQAQLLMPPGADPASYWRAWLAHEDGRGAPRERYPRAPSLADEILARSKETWIPLCVGGVAITSLPPRALAILIGASGAGKSPLAAAMLSDHARHRGPAVYATLELDGPELGARIVGEHVGESWQDVLRGRVELEAMRAALPGRLVVADGAAAEIDELEHVVADLRAQHGPSESVLCAVDYVQIVGLRGLEVRAQTARALEQLRVVAKRLGVLIVGVSQTSRVAGRELRGGERVGADTMDAGAESAQIERVAYLTLALGAQAEADADGWAPVGLSFGKARFGGGDRVLPLHYHGAHGRWRVAGEMRAAADVRAERAGADNTGAVQAASSAILTAAERSTAPASKAELRVAAARSWPVVDAAIASCIADGSLVTCAARPRQTQPTYWTPARVNSTRQAQQHADRARTGERDD